MLPPPPPVLPVVPLPPPPPLPGGPPVLGPQALSLDQLPLLLTCALHTPGWATLDGATPVSAKGFQTPILQPISAAEAFGTNLPNDRFLVLYGFRVGSDEAGWEQAPAGVRMTGPGLALMQSVRAHPENFPENIVISCQAQVVGHALAVDYDLPGHGTWDTELIREHQDMINRAAVKNPLVGSPSVAYMTKGGFRLVWFLTEDVPIEGARGLKDLLPGLVAAMHVAGVQVDPSCRDWTRLFRLPRVMREVKREGSDDVEHVPTAQQSYMRQSWGRVDFSANEPLPLGGQVVAYHPSVFKGISETAEQELLAARCTELVAHYKHIIGRVPQEGSRASQVSVGERPGNDVVAQIIGGEIVQDAATGDSEMVARKGATETAEIGSVRTWLRRAMKGTVKSMPSAHAAYAFNHVFGDHRFISQMDPGASGQLHAGITKVTMALVSTLRNELTHYHARPQVLYSLVLRCARLNDKLRPPAQRRHDDVLCNEVWSIVSWAFRAEMGVREDIDEQQRQEEEAGAVASQVQKLHSESHKQLIKQALGRMIEKQPGSDPNCPPSPEQFEWLNKDDQWQKHLIIMTPRGASVLSIAPDGSIFYSDPCETFKELVVAVRLCGHELITLFKTPAKDGGEDTMRYEADLMFEYASPAKDFRLSRLIPYHQATLRYRNGRADAFFTQALKGLNKTIEPQFDADIHEWLHALAGNGPKAELLFDWLAAFWVLDRPATMLHIEGTSDSGKSLLVKGLKACTESNATARVADMFGDFQDMALQTPLLVADEEYNTNQPHKSFVNILKKLSTGEENTINAKGKAAVQIEGFWRVILVENGTRMLQFKEDMSAADEEALLKRLLCVVADGPACRRVIERVGGAAGVESWIKYKLPRHIKWLSVNRELSTTDRVLAMDHAPGRTGNQVGSNTMDKVIRAIGLMLENPNVYRQGVSYVMQDDAMLVSMEALTTGLKDSITKSDEQMPSQHALREVLRTLTGMKAAGQRRIQGTNKRLSAWIIPLSMLLPRIAKLNEHVNIREAVGEACWLKHMPKDFQDQWDNAPLVNVKRASAIEATAASSRSLGESMRDAALATKSGHANAHTNGNGAHQLPPLPSIMAMSPNSLFSASTLPPPPPPQPSLS